MGKKDKRRLGVVYSTNQDYNYVNSNNQEQDTIDPSEQILRIWLDRKNRRGKEVTLIKGFIGHSEDLKDLAKSLKTRCGVGGSAKDGEIILQGNVRDKAFDYLLKEGYSRTKKAGS